MKKIAAILLGAILLFNAFGFQVLNAWLEARANRDMISNIDHNAYTSADLITLTVPAAHLSGYANRSDFERVDGRITIGGTEYNYVEKRLVGDSLELRCLPNHPVTSIRNAGKDYYRLMADIPQNNGKSQDHSSAKAFSADYLATENDFSFYPSAPAALQPVARYTHRLSICLISFEGQPPDRV